MAQALIQLLDVAVKSGGLSVAEAAVVLARKVQAARQPAPAVSDEV